MISRPAFAGSNISNVKAHNLEAVLRILLHQGAVSRVRLAHLTGLSTTTITNLVAELIEQEIVVEDGRESSQSGGAGRPRIPVRLVPSARHVVGVHIGVGNIRVAVADLFGQVQTYLSMSHERHAPAEEVLARVADLIEEAVATAGVDRERLVGVGVGASGLVDPHTGVNVLAPNLNWRNLPIGDIFRDRLGLPVCVDNNVRAMALAEAMFGAAQEVNTLAFVYGRVGVGAGFVIGGNIYRGSRAGAGEIGHTTIIPVGGAPCRCGNTGCLETLVSESEILRLAQDLAARHPRSILAARLSDTSKPPIEQVFEAARAGDRETLLMLHERAHYMGIALANLVNSINPDMIIIGGLFAAGHDLMLSKMEETMRQRAFANLGDSVELRVTTFGRKVGVIGAAALALDAFFFRQAASA
ncbi:MAG: ROK family transcriptional regulator [Anaerolineae bacterium]